MLTKYPLLFQVNTRVWLTELSRSLRRPGGSELCVLPRPAFMRLPFTDLGNDQWRLEDFFGDAEYDRVGNNLESLGLYLDAPLWHCNAFNMTRLS